MIKGWKNNPLWVAHYDAIKKTRREACITKLIKKAEFEAMSETLLRWGNNKNNEQANTIR